MQSCICIVKSSSTHVSSKTRNVNLSSYVRLVRNIALPCIFRIKRVNHLDTRPTSPGDILLMLILRIECSPSLETTLNILNYAWSTILIQYCFPTFQDYEERRYYAGTWVCTDVNGLFVEQSRIVGFRKLQAYIGGHNAEGMHASNELRSFWNFHTF